MARIKVDRIDVTQPCGAERWWQLCDRAEGLLIQQTMDWCRVLTQAYSDKPCFLIASQNGQDLGGLPLYRFDSELGSIFSSVPGAGALGGVIHAADLFPEHICSIYEALLGYAVALASDEAALALTVISHPLLKDAGLITDAMKPDVVFHNFTQATRVCDVASEGAFILPNNKDRNPGKTIRKARGAGVCTFLATTDSDFRQWLAIHEKRHSELGLAGLGSNLLERVFKEPAPPNGAFLILSELDDAICGGGLFIHTSFCCDAFMLSMDSTYRNEAPNYAVMETAFLEMDRRGIQFFNWQSSPSRQSGVYKFKNQWGCAEYAYLFATRLFVPRDEILKIGRQRLAAAFNGHFIVPFGLFDEPLAQEFGKT